MERGLSLSINITVHSSLSNLSTNQAETQLTQVIRMKPMNNSSKNKQILEKSKTCPQPLPRQPYTWLVIIDGGITYDDDGVKNNNFEERHIFYSVTEDRYYGRFVRVLHNKYVCCCYQGLLILKDKSSDDCYILNILTMEKFQLPSPEIPLENFYQLPPICILSSLVMDTSCRIIFFEPLLQSFRSCHLGDTEFVQQELIYDNIDGMNRNIYNLINFKGKLYALTAPGFNLLTSDFDFEDHQLCFQQLVSGESILNYMYTSNIMKLRYLVESGDDLLLIVMGGYEHEEILDVYIFKADFKNGEWVEVGDSLVDRAIFVGLISTFSSPASAFGLKGNALYWVRTPYGLGPFPRKNLYMYDIEDKSISVSLPCPHVRALSSIFWLSFPVTTCNGKEKSEEQNDRSSLLFEAASPVQTTDYLNRQIGKPRKTQNNIEICPTTAAGTESLWSDIPTDILLEIFPRLFAGEKVAFRCVCRSWYSIPHSLVTSQQHCVPLPPLKNSSDSSSPFLMCPNNKSYHPIYDELYSLDGFQYAQGEKVRAARDGWLLMDKSSEELSLYNLFTKSKLTLPDCDVMSYYYSFYFIPPTSADFLVVVAALRWDDIYVICYMRNMDEGWTYREIPCETLSFYFSYCNPVVHGGLFCFLGDEGNLLIFNPKKDQINIITAPDFISCQLHKLNVVPQLQRYLLESDDGKLIVVFVGENGSSIHVCEWNDLTREWKVLQNLGNKMLFVSRTLSLCKKAIVTGTGNKIYFPRFGGDGHILFYSLATKAYHTFAMGTTYPNFCGSKLYPWYNGWFTPEPDFCSNNPMIAETTI